MIASKNGIVTSVRHNYKPVNIIVCYAVVILLIILKIQDIYVKNRVMCQKIFLCH
jgi:hypothetical protein